MRGMDVFASCFAYSAATHSFVQRPAAAPPTAAYLSVRFCGSTSALADDTSLSPKRLHVVALARST